MQTTADSKIASRQPMQRSGWMRDRAAPDLLEHFLVAAVATILIVRFYLALTGYPQLGGHGLHIAHLLWGGLFMLIGLVMLLTFLGEAVKHTSATIAGVGFGLFIDELGKFITSDNNYFFRPTIAIIYAILIVLFFVFRELAQAQQKTPTWYLANALSLIQDAVIHGWTWENRERAALFLHRSDLDDPVARALAIEIAKLPLVGEHASRAARTMAWLRRQYARLVCVSWFQGAVVAVFGFQIAGSILAMVDEWTGVDLLTLGHRTRADLTFSEWMVGASATIAAVTAIVGIVSLPRSRLVAYRWLRRSVLVSIFFGRFFAFLNVDLATVVGLGLDLLILTVLQYMIAQEHAALAHERLTASLDGATVPLAGARSSPMPTNSGAGVARE